jgi:hypothetical protein
MGSTSNTNHGDYAWFPADVAQTVVNALKINGVEPDERFEAAAGAVIGNVEAWTINGSGQYAIAYGDNAETN